MWSVSKTVNLIEDLHNTPCLWDVRCLDYKNRPKKDEAFEVIGKKYGMNAVDIEKKIQSLRNQFRREHRKYMDAIRAGFFPKSCRWFGYDRMSFLLEVYESRGSRTPMDDNDDVLEISELVTPDNYEDEAGDEGTSDSNTVIEGGIDRRTPLSTPSLKRKLPSDDSTSAETLKCLKTLADSVSRRDEYSVYGEHIANKLRFSGRTRFEIAIAQRKINEICFQLDVGSFSQQPGLDSGVSLETVGNSFTQDEDCPNTLSGSRFMRQAHSIPKSISSGSQPFSEDRHEEDE